MPHSSSTRSWLIAAAAPALAAGLPLLAYVWGAAAFPYWLDSGELTAAAIWLDIAHPPGHPVASLWGKAFSLLPVGSLPLRVALGQGVAAALALLGTYYAMARTLARVGGYDARIAASIAVGATWTLAGTSAFVFQAVRAEVYATQAMLLCFVLAETACLAAREDAHDARPFVRATLALGLALANHHFTALLALPLLAWELLRLTRRAGLRVWGYGLLGGVLGLSVYAYLPLRARAPVRLDFGHPATLANFLWVVSGKLYTGHVGEAATQPLAERLADLLVLLVEQLGASVLALALLGLYALLRARPTRRLGYAWLAAAACSLLGRAWVGSVRANPDVLGYLMPGLAALTVLAAAGFGTLLGTARDATRGGWQRALALLALGPLALGAVRLREGAEEHGLAHFAATQAFDRAREADLPPDSLLVATTPTLAFHFWAADASEHVRPDLILLPLTFLNYPDAAARQAARTPWLAPLIDASRRGTLGLAPLRALATTRPVYVELDAQMALPVMSHLLPDGLLYRVQARPPSPTELARAAEVRARRLAALTREVARDLRDQETARQLLFLRYVDAIYFAHHGARAAALQSVARGLEIYPETRELRGLRDALLRVREGVPLDVSPFLAARRP